MTKKDSLINQVCKAWGWKQKDLADKMGYSLQAIRNVSSNNEVLTLPMQKHLETLLELAELHDELKKIKNTL